MSKLRGEKIVIPGVSAIERMAAEAMHAADLKVIAEVDTLLLREQRTSLDAICRRRHTRASRGWLGCGGQEITRSEYMLVFLVDQFLGDADDVAAKPRGLQREVGLGSGDALDPFGPLSATRPFQH